MAAGKTCTLCKWWKPLDQFYRNAQRFDGYGSECKSCRSTATALVRAQIMPTIERSRQIRERLIQDRRMPVLRQALQSFRTKALIMSRNEHVDTS